MSPNSPIKLRELSLEDCTRIWTWWEDEARAQGQTTAPQDPAVPNPAAWHAQINEDQGLRHMRYGIWAGSELIGDIALQDLDWHNGTATIGMGIRSGLRNQGLGQKALALLLDLARHLKLKQLSARTDKNNGPAIGSLLASGFSSIDQENFVRALD